MAISGKTAVQRELARLKKQRNSLAKMLTALDTKIKSRAAALDALQAIDKPAPATLPNT